MDDDEQLEQMDGPDDEPEEPYYTEREIRRASDRAADEYERWLYRNG